MIIISECDDKPRNFMYFFVDDIQQEHEDVYIHDYDVNGKMVVFV